MKLVSLLFLIGMMYLSYRVVKFIIALSSGRKDMAERGMELLVDHIRALNQELRRKTPRIHRLKTLHEEGERLVWACRNESLVVHPEHLNLLIADQEMLMTMIQNLESKEDSK